MTQRTTLDRRSFIKTGAFLSASAAVSPAFDFSLSAPLLAQEADAAKTPKFVAAEPVWQKGRAEEMNVTLVFFAQVNIKPDAVAGAFLRCTGSSVFRVSVDNKPVAYGPARGPHGWFRVDEWDMSKYLKGGAHFLTIEVAGYNSNSFDILDQPSFLQAELIDGSGAAVVATKSVPGKGAFEALDFTGVRVQKVQRFSFQRPFIEVYKVGDHMELETIELEKQPDVHYLPRRVPYPEFAVFEPAAWGKTGKVEKLPKVDAPWRDRSLVNIGPQLKGYKLDELDVVLSDEMQALKTTFDESAKPLELGSTYNAGDVQIVDFGANYCGFFGVEIETKGETEVALTFDEILTPDGDVNFLRLGTCSAIKWTIEQNVSNTYEAFSPHVGRYAKLHCLKGSFKLKRFYLREYAYPPTREASFDSSDPRLAKIYKAAVLTFRENSVDVFTDCPHRERAGWLCDSFFTSRSAFDLTGRTDVEQAFFENYMLPESFKFLPDGVLPMCYPSDHYDGVFIPNWTMWFVAELKEYARRSPDQSTVKGLRKKIEKLFAFFQKYENSDGLLEKLPSWVFVEWSKANDFVQDVNYPSNMCYAYVLDAAGELYGVPEWKEKAEKIRKVVREQSYDGEFFVDHALRTADGKLEIQRDRTEVCQYFAFFFETATPDTYPELWATLLDKFGPNRIKDGVYPEIFKANAFVGNVLRLELLAKADRGAQLLDESLAYNEYMADRTGTLWENDDAYASCNHGFASHVVRVLYRNILGIADVDAVAKKIAIRVPKIDNLQWAAGVQPVPGGKIKMRWEKKDGKMVYSLETPDDYNVVIDNVSGLELVKA